ncbi:MAG: translation initiation factor eIF-2B [Candidatus Nanohaloarchaea archaeon]
MDAEETLRKIREVEIQGATNVAREGVKLLREMDSEGASRERLERVMEELEDARPTEPLLFNAIDIVRETGDYGRVLEHLESSRERIVKKGKDLVEEGDTVYTHCHSSTVTSVLKEASKGRDFEAKVTETRPLYQGRVTAEELAEADIPVELYVDSAAHKVLQDADMMFIGADAVIPGGVVNKIGSGLFARTANTLDVPVHVFTDSWKYTGEADIEERPPGEIWEDAPGGVEIRNPAFEVVPHDDIESVVSELGREIPKGFIGSVEDEYPEVVM